MPFKRFPINEKTNYLSHLLWDSSDHTHNIDNYYCLCTKRIKATKNEKKYLCYITKKHDISKKRNTKNLGRLTEKVCYRADMLCDHKREK